jgi:hypothetical protein
MKDFWVTTGFGYFVDDKGHITSKAVLPIGQHLIKDGFTYVEVANGVALDAIQLWVDPVMVLKATQEGKIGTKIRQDAIDALITAGELPAGYK